jgi:hypothetical protein
MHLNLKLSVDEANVILGVLSQHPYSKVFQLIQSIQAQAAEQLLQLEKQRMDESTMDPSENNENGLPATAEKNDSDKTIV